MTMAEHSPKDGRAVRPRKACTNCRSMKTRCLPEYPDDPPEADCTRCRRLTLECVYKWSKRGPPKGWKQRAGRGELTESPVDTVGLQRTSNATDRSPCEVVGHWRGAAAYLGAGPQHTNNSPDAIFSMSESGSVLPSTRIIQPTSPVHSFARSLPSETLEAHLEPHLGPGDSRPLSASPGSMTLPPPPQPVVIYPDPVSLGLLLETEARFLFNEFIFVIEESSGLFDPAYHTYERVRSSPVLFNAVIFAATRFLRPALSESILDMADTCVNRALKIGVADITLIQALLTLVYWKRPTDRTAYTKLGQACRLVHSLRLQWPKTLLGPHVSLEMQRQHANVTRTIFNAFGMESSYAAMFRLPSIGSSLVPGAAELRAWAVSVEQVDVPGDYYKSFLRDMWGYHLAHGSFPVADVDSDRPDSAPHTGLIVLEQLVSYWEAEPRLRGVWRSLVVILGNTSLVKVSIAALKVSGSPPAESIMAAAERVSAEITTVVRSGQVRFWSDMTCCMMSSVGILLYRAREYLSPEQLGRAASCCQTMADAFDSLPTEFTANHALGYNLRSYRRLQGAFERLYEAAETGQSMAPISKAARAYDADVATQLNTFLQGLWPDMDNSMLAPQPGNEVDWLLPIL